MKKYLKVIGISLGIVGLVLLFALKKNSKVNQVTSLGCSKAGEEINSVGKTNRCCAGLSETGETCPEDDCDCKFPIPGGIVKCSDCGNGICERENLENHCNCPQDCKKLKDTCGNGKCEQVNGEDKTFCLEDCLIAPKGAVFDNKLELVEFKGECKSEEFEVENKILKQSFIGNDILEVKVQTEVACCVDFKGTIKSEQNVIDLRFVETGEPCDCLCKGVLNYKIKGAEKRKYQFYLNGKLIK